MQGSLDQPPIVIRSSLSRTATLLLGSGAFVLGGLFLLAQGRDTFADLLAIGFFGLCGLVALAMLIVPPRLEIGPSGLTQTVLWRKSRFVWTDVYDFHPKTLGLATKGIGFRYVRLLQGVRAPSSRNTILLGGWEIDEQALADLLNAARERWLSADPEGPRTDIPRPRPTLIGAMTGPRINRKAYWLVVISVLAVAFASSYIPGLSRGIAPVVTLPVREGLRLPTA